MDEIEGEIYQVRNRSNQDPLNFPIKVNNRLANLLSMSERGDGRPGEGMVEVFGVMVGRLGGVLGELPAVWGTELVEVNAALRRLRMEGIGGMEKGKEVVASTPRGLTIVQQTARPIPRKLREVACDRRKRTLPRPYADG